MECACVSCWLWRARARRVEGSWRREGCVGTFGGGHHHGAQGLYICAPPLNAHRSHQLLHSPSSPKPRTCKRPLLLSTGSTSRTLCSKATPPTHSLSSSARSPKRAVAALPSLCYSASVAAPHDVCPTTLKRSLSASKNASRGWRRGRQRGGNGQARNDRGCPGWLISLILNSRTLADKGRYSLACGSAPRRRSHRCRCRRRCNPRQGNPKKNNVVTAT